MILQTEDSTSRTLLAFSTATKSIHYLKYDHKKGSKGWKGHGWKKTPSSATRTPSISHNNMPKLCFHCKKEYAQGHEKECRALKAKYNHCGLIGHFKKCCCKAGNFPKKPQSMVQWQHIAASESTSQEGLDFYDEVETQKLRSRCTCYSLQIKTPLHDICHSVTFMHSLHLVNQSTGLVTQVYIKCPSSDGPEDCHTKGRWESALCIWVDMTLYTCACIGDPHQFAL